MRQLDRLWHREGAGVPKDEAPKTGLARLGATIRREAGDLLTLNALIVLASIPIVTIPAAQTSGMRIALRMLDDEPIYLWREFWRGLRDVLPRATGFAALGLASTGAAGWCAWIYAQMALHSPIFAAPFVVAAAMTLLASTIGLQGLVLIAAEETPRPRLIRRAAIATLVRPLPVFAGLAAVVTLWLAVMLFYPVSVLLPVTVGFSIGSLVAVFAMRPVEENRTAGNRASTLEET